MAVKVKEHDKPSLVFALELDYDLLESPDFRNQEVIAHLEGPVEVSTAKGSSKVTNNHSIRVQHRNDLKDHVPA